MHGMHTSISWTVSSPKNRAEYPENCQKITNLVTDVLKDPKTSLESIRMTHNAFFATTQFMLLLDTGQLMLQFMLSACYYLTVGLVYQGDIVDMKFLKPNRNPAYKIF